MACTRSITIIEATILPAIPQPQRDQDVIGSGQNCPLCALALLAILSPGCCLLFNLLNLIIYLLGALLRPLVAL